MTGGARSVGDVIVALATAPGPSERAILRLTGDHAFETLDAVTATQSPRARGCHEARLVLSPDRSVPPLPCGIVCFPGPKSPTGEDCAELWIPGGPALVDRVLFVLRAAGARDAEPGEFSARSYLHGVVSLDEAEGVAAIISAERDAALLEARKLLDGTAGARYRAWADRLARALSLVEAGVDFAEEEDVVPIAPSNLFQELGAIVTELTPLVAGVRTFRAGGAPIVAIVGEPSTGKSTLFNALLGRARAVTHEDAGTTRDALREPLVLPGGETVELMDLPGLDDGDDGELGRAVRERALESLADADLVLWCDPTGRFERRPTVQDAKASWINVRTKADRSAAADETSAVEVCALSRAGLEQLARAIESELEGISPLPSRHARALDRCREAVHRAQSSFEPSEPALSEPAIVAENLRESLHAIGEITGRLDPDEILGRIFAGFCIGK
ncbi:MAG: GTPase [Planctomycetota bacterium]